MITPEKIEEWLKEAEERPSSMAVIMADIMADITDIIPIIHSIHHTHMGTETGDHMATYDMMIPEIQLRMEEGKDKVLILRNGTTIYQFLHQEEETAIFQAEPEQMLQENQLQAIHRSPLMAEEQEHRL